MRKKKISLLLCIVLCLSLMPMSAFAAEDYGIMVNGTDITSDNATDVIIDGVNNGKVIYDSTEGKLSIGSFVGELTIEGNGTVNIEVNGDSTTAVTGKLTVTDANNVSVTSNSLAPTLLGGAEIACNGDVMIKNEGNGLAVATGLTVTSAKNVTVTSKGWVVGGDLTVNCAGNVTVKKATTSDNTNAAVTGKATIDCTGDVLLESYGNSNAVGGPLTVNAANDVTVTSAGEDKPILNSGAKITCSGNITIENSSTGGGISGGPLTIIGAKDVIVASNSLAPTVTNGADIACTGNVAITNEGNGLAVTNGLKVTDAKNVTVTSKGQSCSVITPGGSIGTEITCTGDVSIINKSTGDVVYGNLTVDGAKNVTVKNEVSNNSPNGAITMDANITCSGDVLIQCYGTGKGNAVGGKFTYHRISGAGSYYVNVGDTESELTTIATKAESEVYGPENRNKKIINIVSIPVGAYTIIDNVNSEWTKGSSVGLTITSDAPFDKFIGVKIDGNEIAATNYTAASGSTKITLNAAYLETLSEGSHSIDVVSIDGVASTNFTIKATNSTIKATNSTQTGDNSNMLLWVVLLFISGGALAGTAVYGRKRKHN